MGIQPKIISVDYDLFVKFCKGFKTQHDVLLIITEDKKALVFEKQYEEKNDLIRVLVSQVTQSTNETYDIELCPYDVLNHEFESALTYTNNKLSSEGNLESKALSFINERVKRAISINASDIHCHLTDKLFVHYRVDKKLRKSLTEIYDDALGHRVFNAIINTTKGGDIDHDVEQSKNIPLEIDLDDGTQIKVMIRGEKTPIYSDAKNSQALFLRINKSEKPHTLDELNVDEPLKNAITRNMQKNQGMILVTGPTGSGKTTLLGGAVWELPKDKSLRTIEDPVELRLDYISPFITQNSVEKTRWDKSLESILRQDPDSVLMGELRTLFQANKCIDAANTGHLVMSTLHTNSATETISRLLSMGVNINELLADKTLNLLIATKLAPKVCQCCALRYEELPADKKDKLKILNLTDAQLSKLRFSNNLGPNNSRIPGVWNQNNPIKLDCSAMCNEGTKGVEGVTEFLEITPAIRSFIRERGSTEGLEEMLISKGWLPLEEIALIKVKQGILDPFEIKNDVTDLLAPRTSDSIDFSNAYGNCYNLE